MYTEALTMKGQTRISLLYIGSDFQGDLNSQDGSPAIERRITCSILAADCPYRCREYRRMISSRLGSSFRLSGESVRIENGRLGWPAMRSLAYAW